MLPILFEDNYLLAVNKPPGLQVERDRFGNPSAEHAISEYLKNAWPWKKQLITGMVHRLDRPVSGVLLVAKTPMALKALGAQFEKREIRKIYRAVVEGAPTQPEGELTHWLLKNENDRRMEVATARHPKAQNCRLRYKTLRQTEGHSLLEIELLTGRYHQIRAQLSAIGNPIAGDVKYGAVPALPLDSICLHAFHLAFFHPKNSETVRIEAPLPALGAWALFA